MIWLLKLLPWLGKLSPALALVKGNGKLISAGLTVLSVLGTMWYISNLKDNISDLERDKGMYIGWLNECQIINVKNQNAVRTLKAANASLATAAIVSDDLLAESVLAAQERERRAQIQLDDTLETLQELQNESLSCNEFMEIDMGAVCPLSVERLREHAAGTADN